ISSGTRTRYGASRGNGVHTQTRTSAQPSPHVCLSIYLSTTSTAYSRLFQRLAGGAGDLLIPFADAGPSARHARRQIGAGFVRFREKLAAQQPTMRAANPAIASRLGARPRGRGVGELERSAKLRV